MLKRTPNAPSSTAKATIDSGQNSAAHAADAATSPCRSPFEDEVSAPLPSLATPWGSSGASAPRRRLALDGRRTVHGSLWRRCSVTETTRSALGHISRFECAILRKGAEMTAPIVHRQRAIRICSLRRTGHSSSQVLQCHWSTTRSPWITCWRCTAPTLPQRSHMRGTSNAIGLSSADRTKENRMLSRVDQCSEKRPLLVMNELGGGLLNPIGAQTFRAVQNCTSGHGARATQHAALRGRRHHKLALPFFVDRPAVNHARLQIDFFRLLHTPGLPETATPMAGSKRPTGCY